MSEDGRPAGSPTERSSAEYSATEIAIARAIGKLRVDDDGCGWIHDREPSGGSAHKLSDDVRRIVHAFDSGDSRRDDVRALADRVRLLECQAVMLADRLRWVDMYMECDFGGFYLSAPDDDPLARIRKTLRGR